MRSVAAFTVTTMRKLWNRAWTWYKGLHRAWQVIIAIGLGICFIGSMQQDKEQQKIEAKAAAVEAKKHEIHRPYPEVRGVNLVDAEKVLKTAGYSATVHAKDAAMGILVRENFTVCESGTPIGKLVPITVAHECGD